MIKCVHATGFYIYGVNDSRNGLLHHANKSASLIKAQARGFRRGHTNKKTVKIKNTDKEDIRIWWCINRFILLIRVLNFQKKQDQADESATAQLASIYTV